MRRAAIGALLVGLLLALPQAAPAGSHFTDAGGDSGTAPDITAVDVANDAAGTVTFTIGYTPPLLASDEGLGLYIDSDQNASTGNRYGADRVLFVYPGSWDWYAWNGTQFAAAPHGAMTVAPTAVGTTIALTTADLGGATAFRFWANSQQGSGSTLAAGDITSIFTYTLATAVKLVPVLKPASALAVGIRPGARLAVTAAVGLSDGTAVAPDPGTTACKATIAGSALPAAPACSWAVPRTAKGRTIVLSVTAAYAGKPLAARLSIRVAAK